MVPETLNKYKETSHWNGQDLGSFSTAPGPVYAQSLPVLVMTFTQLAHDVSDVAVHGNLYCPVGQTLDENPVSNQQMSHILPQVND